MIAALAIVMGYAVSTFLTSAMSDWESESMASFVRREVDEAGLETLLQDARGPGANERWQATLSRVLRYVPGLVRCKVWNREGVVVWSDDATLIGKQEVGDPDLRAAFTGRVVARLTEPASDDSDWVRRFSVLTRIYVPVASKSGGPIQGVVEVRRVPSRLSGQLGTALLIIWGIALAGGAACWLVVRPLFGRAQATGGVGQAGPPVVDTRTAAQISTAIQERFGFFPPFFEPALEAPGVLENLWQQTLSAYVNNPIPALFKETLFAYLSRYCAVPYCIVCHSCALRPLGMTAADVLRLLESPPRTEVEVTAQLTLLAAQPGPVAEWPPSGSPLEEALIDCSVLMFLHPDRAERCQTEMRRVLGPNYSYLAEFLAYVKTCHFWVEAHPELAYEADQRAQANLGALVAQEARLAEFFRDYRERVRRERQAGEARRLVELGARAAELASVNEALRMALQQQARERRGRAD